MNHASRYTTTAISLHWLMAVLIFAGFGMGQYMTDLAMSPDKLRMYSWHKWIGVTVFGLLFTPVFYVVGRWLSGLMPQGPSGSTDPDDWLSDDDPGAERADPEGGRA